MGKQFVGDPSAWLLQKLFQSISSDNDSEWLFIDGSIVKAHQESCGAASSTDEAIGKSRSGNSTKIHLAVDSGGLPRLLRKTGSAIGATPDTSGQLHLTRQGLTPCKMH